MEFCDNQISTHFNEATNFSIELKNFNCHVIAMYVIYWKIFNIPVIQINITLWYPFKTTFLWSLMNNCSHRGRLETYFDLFSIILIVWFETLYSSLMHLHFADNFRANDIFCLPCWNVMMERSISYLLRQSRSILAIMRLLEIFHHQNY